MNRLRCPGCGSTDVWCEEDKGIHRHGCNTCLRIDDFSRRSGDTALKARTKARMEREGIPFGEGVS